jgi:CheY-like chemotaxis protein/sRNA-binding carbon storage regulator CsrA
LKIAVEVVRVSGKVVRLGVEAPSDIKILREEVATPEDFEAPEQAKSESRKQVHDLRNQLHTANLYLHVLKKQMEKEKFDDAENTLEEALTKFAEVDQMAALAATGKSQPRALLVEDNAQERELLAGYLRLCGYEVDTVGDGIEALEYLDEHSRPDVILLDMQMPRMSGQQMVSKIRQNPRFRDLKLIAVTGADRDVFGTSDAGERGVDRWYSKPLNPSQFVEQLREEIVA